MILSIDPRIARLVSTSTISFLYQASPRTLSLGVDSPAMATLPDFGNFPEEIILSGMAQIMPWAAGVHVKWTRRDKDRNLAPGKRDVPALVKIAKQAGFNGTLFIEDGGPVCDHVGVLEMKGALLAALNSSLV